MATIAVKYECRAPAGVAAMNFEDLYATALEQIAWIDAQGYPVTINFCVHHGCDDGYLPAPITFAAAAAMVTKQVRLQANVILPFHDPLRVAEDTAVLDILSHGRAELLLLGGYVQSEWTMFGVDPKQRAALMEEGIAALKNAWTGKPFEYRGRQCQIRPRPLQQPHPPLWMGGTTPPAARRAARLGDGFMPGLPELYNDYANECERLGKIPRAASRVSSNYLYVSDDPEKTWQQLAPYALYETNYYARWQSEAGQGGIFKQSTDIAAVRNTGVYQVKTAEQILAEAPFVDDYTFMLHPLISGCAKDFSWQTIKNFFERIAPTLSLHY